VNFDFGRVRLASANHNARFTAKRMHSKEGMGGLMFEFNQTVKFLGRQNHATSL
jgi:hypothetical protein